MIHSVIDPYTERQTMGFGGVLQEYVQITVLVPVASLTGADCTHAAMLPDGRYLTVEVREAAEASRQLAAYDPASSTSHRSRTLGQCSGPSSTSWPSCGRVMSDALLLALVRDIFTDDATLSTLSIGPDRFGYVCEDEDRGLMQRWTEEQIRSVKVKSETAIPVGTYRVSKTWSPKYEAADVPRSRRAGVRWDPHPQRQRRRRHGRVPAAWADS
jgi:hypothetical protein